jgi:hypothetical protein
MFMMESLDSQQEQSGLEEVKQAASMPFREEKHGDGSDERSRKIVYRRKEEK